MNYYTEKEVAKHCYRDDIWIVIFGKVYNLTKLIKENSGNELTEPLIKYAGKSVSHWFNKTTGDLKTFIDPVREIELPYIPDGRFLHVPPKDPQYFEIVQLPWWKNEAYVIGNITKKQRSVKILNVLTQQEDIIDVCNEDDISIIMNHRYMEYNKHGSSYTWKALINDTIVNLDMDKTLHQNGIIDESESFEKVGLEDNFYLPTLLLYYNDDLTDN